MRTWMVNYKKKITDRVKVGGSLTAEKLETKMESSVFVGRRNG